MSRQSACPLCEGSDPSCYICHGRGTISEAAAEQWEGTEQERADVEGVWEDSCSDCDSPASCVCQEAADRDQHPESPFDVAGQP